MSKKAEKAEESEEDEESINLLTSVDSPDMTATEPNRSPTPATQDSPVPEVRPSLPVSDVTFRASLEKALNEKSVSFRNIPEYMKEGGQTDWYYYKKAGPMSVMETIQLDTVQELSRLAVKARVWFAKSNEKHLSGIWIKGYHKEGQADEMAREIAVYEHVISERRKTPRNLDLIGKISPIYFDNDGKVITYECTLKKTRKNSYELNTYVLLFMPNLNHEEYRRKYTNRLLQDLTSTFQQEMRGRSDFPFANASIGEDSNVGNIIIDRNHQMRTFDFGNYVPKKIRTSSSFTSRSSSSSNPLSREPPPLKRSKTQAVLKGLY